MQLQLQLQGEPEAPQVLGDPTRLRQILVNLLGNALNFGLNLIGCYVHDLRLQCLEYFNKFYTDGGRPFRPLKVRSKYYNVTK